MLLLGGVWRNHVSIYVFFYFLFIYLFISCTLFILCVFVWKLNMEMVDVKEQGGVSVLPFDSIYLSKYSLWWKFIFVAYDTKIINYVLRKWCVGSILVEGFMVALAWESYSFVWFPWKWHCNGYLSIRNISRQNLGLTVLKEEKRKTRFINTNTLLILR